MRQINLAKIRFRENYQIYPDFFIFMDGPDFEESLATKTDYEFRLTPKQNVLVKIETFINESYQQKENFLEAKKQDLTEPARETLRNITNREIVEEAEKILGELYKALNEIDTSKLPPIRAFEMEGGSILIEWIFSHHRIGFNIEQDSHESGWFLVSDKSAQGINAWGLLPDENLEWLMAWLIKPIIDFYL